MNKINILQPKCLKEYVGQKKICDQMSVFMQAAKLRNEPLDHLLIFGPPGLGKTTLANIIANEMGVTLRTTSGPILEKAGDVAAILTNLKPCDILFIDEIHRLSPIIEEILYPAMENYQLQIIIGDGPAARSISINLAPFTLIGATTSSGSLTAALRDRFGIIQRIEFYSVQDLKNIVIRNAHYFHLNLKIEDAYEIASRSRGTPRIANRILKRVRDFFEVCNNKKENMVIHALNMLNIDTEGFDSMDRKLLSAIIHKFTGGPVGIENLASAIGEKRKTIEEVLEPYLIQKGFIQRTSRGRIATKNAYQYFGIKTNF